MALPVVLCSVDGVQVPAGTCVYQPMQQMIPTNFCTDHWPVEGVAKLNEILRSCGISTVQMVLVFDPDVT